MTVKKPSSVDTLRDVTQLFLDAAGAPEMVALLANRLNAAVGLEAADGEEMLIEPPGSELALELAQARKAEAPLTQMDGILHSGRASALVWSGSASVWLVPMLGPGSLAPRLWVARAESDPLDDDERWVLEGCGLLLAMEGARVEQRTAAEANFTADLLSELVSIRTSAHTDSVMARAAAHGLDPGSNYTSAVVILTAPPGSSSSQLSQSQITAELIAAAGDTVRRPMIGPIGDAIVVLTADEGHSVSHGDSTSRLLTRMIVRVRERTGGTAHWVIGAGSHTLIESGKNISTLLRAAALITPASPELLHLADFGVQGLLLECGPSDALAKFAASILAPIVEIDRQTNGELITTLKTWLASNMSTRDTARELLVHVNTVSYRLRRIASATGLRLDSPPNLINLQLALMVADIQRGR